VQILEPIIRSIRKGTSLSVQQITEYLKDWDAIAIQDEDQHVGTLIAKGCEIHIALVEGYQPKSSKRRIIKQFLQPLFDEHGYVTTRIRHSSLKEKRFVERVGFTPSWKDADFQYYFLGVMPFERKTK
jgi:hypothetical protein